jgi:caffeoyl-CoA O-methyltransferase
MNFLPEEIENYALSHSEPEPELLKELNRNTHLNVLQPRMLSGHLQGRFLSMISKIHKPDNILEIGTYTGYSALCLAEGLSITGELHTIDNNEELNEFALSYFRRSSFASRIIKHTADATRIIPTLDKTWDMVFIDADKSNYLKYYNMVIERMNPGGIIIADNVLWSGKVLQDDIPASDKDTLALQEFNEFITRDTRVEKLLLPIRDGLMCIRKKDI